MAPRLIFAASTGRCGTGYLANMLALLPDVTARHEPQPDFVTVMRAAQRDPLLAAQFWREKKLPAINDCATPVYVETSHLFCKGFAEPLAAIGTSFDLIDLSRPHREVASSLYRLNTIPGRTTQGLAYYLHPDDPVLLPMADWRSMHDYQLCYWYCLEIAQRRKQIADGVRTRGGRVVSVTLSELIDGEGLLRLMDVLELPKTNGWSQFRWKLAKNRVVNKQRTRRDFESLGDVDRLEQEVLERSGQDRHSQAA